MIIDHLSTGATGGAALAAERLHDSLVEEGVQSRLWCQSRSAARAQKSGADWAAVKWRSNEPGLAGMATTVKGWFERRRVKQAQQRVMHNLPAETEYFSFADTGRRTSLDRKQVTGDILHLHWVAGLIDTDSFFASLSTDVPIVWSLHDANPFTGGCHYANDCNAYQTGCQQCPQLGESTSIDHAERNFKIKQAAYGHRDLHILAPSQWIADASRKSLLLGGAAVKMIRHGIDTELFHPTDKAQAKRSLGIDPTDTVIGFGADSLRNPRKGMRELLESLSKLGRRPQTRCLLFGNGTAPQNVESLPSLTHAGFIADPHKLAQVYAAADLFVFPTRGEACGLTGVEAMACATPVIAFDAPGVNEYVLHEKTGLLAAVGNTSDLAHAIERLLADANLRQQLGRNARQHVEQEFQREKQARLYVQWYESILKQHHASARRAA